MRKKSITGEEFKTFKLSKRSVTVKCRKFKLSVTVETLTSVIGNCLTDELITLLDQNVRLRSLSAY